MRRSLAVAVALAAAVSATAHGGQRGAARAAAADLSGTWGPRFVYALDPNPPMLPDTLKQFKAANPDDDPLRHCKPPGVPRVTNMAFPFEIVQTPEVVYLLFEYRPAHPADLHRRDPPGGSRADLVWPLDRTVGG